MEKFTFTPLKLNGAFVISPKPFGDERGFFMELYNSRAFEEHGIMDTFAQDNHSRSQKNVVRGLHFRRDPHAESKIVYCFAGKIFDVVVDVRSGSPTFGVWDSVELSSENKRMIYIPKGFAHGFCVLSNSADIFYKVTGYYMPEYEAGVRWDDPDIGISWPVKNPIVSEKDSKLPLLREIFPQ